MNEVLTRVERQSNVGGVRGTTRYRVLDHGGEPIVGPKVAIVGCMHGNEVVGGYALERLAERIDGLLTCGEVLAVIANEEARKLNLRHTPDGQDMNRLWDRDCLAGLAKAAPKDLCYEERRVRALAPLLLECEVLLDIHSTSRPSPPCVMFRDDRRHRELVRKLGVRQLVTGVHEGGIVDGGICSNIGLAPGDMTPRLGFTFEAGQHVAPGNIDRAWSVIGRLLGHLGMWRNPCDAPPGVVQVYEVVDRFRQAPEGTEPYRFVGFDGGEQGGERRGPARHLASFETIEPDEIILRRGRDTVVRASSPFTMLMPAPAAEPGTDLYYLTQRRHGGLGGEYQDNTHAALQAKAIERMLDLVADDAFDRGVTTISFDARQVLDLCAEVVGRVTRLSEDHVHRRLTVMGRGDWGGGESEQRVGKRYRQAMLNAMAAGVPVDRVQLLRGAPLGWFDVLTSANMRAALAQRAHERSEGKARLFLSTNQPHTVSVLIAGDLETALATGSARYVRVGLIIEAATVEPDGISAQVRVVRAGLFSSRPEFLEVAATLVDSLVKDHKELVSTWDESTGAGLSGMMDDDRAIVLKTESDLIALRAGLSKMQSDSWRSLARAELPEALHFAESNAVGAWLAGFMATTGILDADALHALLVRRDDDGWVIDPAGFNVPIETVMTRVHQGRQRLRMPHQVLSADEVNADNMERWVGWKRHIASAQQIPDRRGKDVDLEVSSVAIRRRLATWFRRARELAIRRPGDVLVVVAGDGLHPVRDPEQRAWQLLMDHRALVRDARVRYLRILHTHGTHLAWLKDFLHTVGERGEQSEPVAVLWETEHGGTINVIMLAVRDGEVNPSSLEGWRFERCAVLLSDLKAHSPREHIGLFTEDSLNRGASQELLHFARSHCEGLITQVGEPIRFERGVQSCRTIENAVVHQLGHRLERTRQMAARWDDLESEEQSRWIADQLGIVDLDLSPKLIELVKDPRPTEELAKELWAMIRPWPGSQGWADGRP